MSRTAPPAFSGLVLVSLGLFLYSRWSGGSLVYYINQRFAGLILATAVGLVLVGLRLARQPRAHGHDQACNHSHESGHSHDHRHHGWGALLLLVVPMVLGLAVPARPLGASAMAGREIHLGGVDLGSSSVAFERRLRGPLADKTIVDWLYAFQTAEDKRSLLGEEVNVVGFVYRDSQLLGQDATADDFFVSRFILSCCVADASPVSLMVRWQGAAQLESDAWVRVKGRLTVVDRLGRPLPLVEASSVVTVTAPTQPYLYP